MTDICKEWKPMSLSANQYQQLKGGIIMRYLTEQYVKMQSMLKDEKGATMVEYALMVALIAVVCIAAVSGVATALNTEFGNVTAAL